MFTGDKHKFKAYEHIFKGGEHKFTARKHKIISAFLICLHNMNSYMWDALLFKRGIYSYESCRIMLFLKLSI